MTKQERLIKRDRKMVETFHHLYNVKRRRMDDVINELADDYFYLDPKYIYSRIFYNKENSEYYYELNEKK